MSAEPSTRPGSPAQALRAATHDQHVALESQPLSEAISSATVSADDYRGYLVRLYALVREVEGRVRGAGAGSPAAWADGERLTRLTADIAAMGGDLPPERELPRDDSAATLWGLMYVIEGSMLGGTLLASRLARRADLAGALSYLSGSSDRTAARWRAFCADMERALRPEQWPEAVAAARRLFARFGSEVLG